MKTYYVYIMASKTKTIYIGITNDLEKRVFEHKSGLTDGFTKKYQLHKLVYFEDTHSASEAIAREKQLKKWRRDKKIHLIESANPHWKDLSNS